MIHKQIGRSDLIVSEAAVGMWAMSQIQSEWRYETDENSILALTKAVDMGINFIDTAEVYGGGYSESLIAKAFGKKTENLVIASKVGFIYRTPGVEEKDHSFSRIIEACEGSLNRLGREYIDLYYIHVYDEVTPVEETVKALSMLLSQGKIRYAGLSNFPLKYMQDLHAELPIIAYQPMYNLLVREIETSGYLDWCRKENITTITYSPTYFGYLTGKFHKGKPLPDDFRKNEPLYNPEGIKKTRSAMNVLFDVARKAGKTPSQVALRWIADHDQVIPIIGARDPIQAEENVGATGWNLSVDDSEKLSHAFPVKGFTV